MFLNCFFVVTPTLFLFRLTVTKVVFECDEDKHKLVISEWLTVTKVVFELGFIMAFLSTAIRLTVTKVVFE